MTSRFKALDLTRTRTRYCRIYNSEGKQVGFHDDVDYAAGRVNSRLAFSPEITGAYYLSAGAYRGNPTQDNSGLYQVALYDVDADPLRLVGTEEITTTFLPTGSRVVPVTTKWTARVVGTGWKAAPARIPS